MIVGLDGWKPEDDKWFRKLGVTWTKLNVDDFNRIEDNFTTHECAQYLQGASEAGITVIGDLRPNIEMHRAIQSLQMDASEEGVAKAESLLAEMRDAAAACVSVFGKWCNHWEWWGEYDCPYVGGFWPQKRVCYPALMQAIYEGIKSVQPEAEVWNGGYGVNFQHQFLTEALAPHAPSSFDCANWHHYNISDYWPRSPQGRFLFSSPLAECVADTAEKFRTLFNHTRAVMTEHGCTQPFVSSEWGMPVVTDEVAAALRGVQVHSNVFDDPEMLAQLDDDPMYFECADGVYALGDAEAAQYFDAWMAVFEEANFEVLIYHRLHDHDPRGPAIDGTFWGCYCGLLYTDGKPKTAMMDVARKWIAKGAQEDD